MVKRPLEGPENAVYWYILQTDSAAEVAFNRYVKLFPPEARDAIFEKRPNESERTVFLAGNRQVHFKSGNKFDNLRVETLHGAIIDECREQSPELWEMVIRPMLTRYQGWCELYSTPNGFDWFYDLYQKATAIPNEWDTFHAPSSEAWWWTKEEILSAKKTMSEAQFAQEILAEFRDLTAGRAYTFSEKNIMATSPFATDLVNYNLPIIVAMDFNITPMAWTLGQRKIRDFYWFDEVWLRGTHTSEAAAVLIEKLKSDEYKAAVKKHGIILIGDATAKASQRAAAGQSDYDILCQCLDNAGIKWVNMTPESNPHIKDRVNTMNAALNDASGVQHVFFNPERCPMAIRDFQRVVWKPMAGGVILDQKTNPDLTHSSDGIGYAICVLSPIQYSNQSSVLSVIIR